MAIRVSPFAGVDEVVSFNKDERPRPNPFFLLFSDI